MPAVGDVSEGAQPEIVGAALTFTVTDPLGAVVPVEPVPLDGIDTPAVAVTLAVLFVVSWTDAVPVVSVVAMVELSVPLSVANVTGTPGRRLPFTSRTLAEIVDVPPVDATVPGEALTPRLCAAAAPTAILTALVP